MHHSKDVDAVPPNDSHEVHASTPSHPVSLACCDNHHAAVKRLANRFYLQLLAEFLSDLHVLGHSASGVCRLQLLSCPAGLQFLNAP